MNTIKKSSLGKLKSVFGSNDENVHTYDLLKQNIGIEFNNVEFAKPIIQNQSGNIFWKASASGPFISYSSLDQDRQNVVTSDIANALGQIEEQISQFRNTTSSIQDALLDRIIELPDEESILISEPDNKIVITEWGFVKDEYQRTEGVLRKILPPPIQSILVKLKYKTEEPVANLSCALRSGEYRELVNSDDHGICRFGPLTRGESFIISNRDNIFPECSFTVDDREEYTIILDKILKLNFKVVNQNDAPISGYQVHFFSDKIGKTSINSDDNGHFLILHPVWDGDFQIFDHNEQKLLQEIIPTSDNNYTIFINAAPPEPQPEANNLEEVRPEEIIEEELNIEAPKKDVIIQFVNRKRVPINDTQIMIEDAQSKKSFHTNDNGEIAVPCIMNDQRYKVSLEYKAANWNHSFKHEAEKEYYTFIVKQRKFLWWWIPLLLFIAILLFLPYLLKQDITVYDNQTMLPIEAAHVSSLYQTVSMNERTDSEGKTLMNYGRKFVYQLLVNRFKANLQAEKLGYYTASGIVPLGLFKTRKTEIYLEPIQLGEYIACGGGTAYTANGDGVYQFDLGKSNSTFRFDYFNDTALDTITVSCKDGQELFKLTTTTKTNNFQHHEMINAPCQFIDVEINGMTNWGIRVNCP